GSAVGETVAALALRQQFRDQVIEQETARGFRRIVVECGGAGAPTDRVPGPHRVGIDALHQPDAALDAADGALDPDPVAVGDAELPRPRAAHIKAIFRRDLPDPAVVRTPRVIDVHRALGDRREGLTFALCGDKRRLPTWKR